MNSERKDILLVEDDEITRNVVSLFLKDTVNVDTAVNSSEALKKASSKKYPLILMDINLKGISGLETTQKLRQTETYKDTPIVAVTAYAMAGDKEKLLDGGCSHYISKPFDKKDIIKLVNELLYEKRG